MNSRTPFRKAAANRADSAKVDAEVEKSSDCTFCWFVLTLYPALTGMSEKDAYSYKDHLKNEHGLGKDIQP
jgi:hypothetical protein